MSKAIFKKSSSSYVPSIKQSTKMLFKEGVVAGMGWAVGVTIGFVLLSSIIVFALNLLGGLPLIGGVIAKIVEATQDQLAFRSVVTPR